MNVKLKDGTGSRTYNYATVQIDRYGQASVYFRRRHGDKKIRLRETPGTAAFDAEYRRAFAIAEGKGRRAAAPAHPAGRKARPAPGSLRWLCEQYFASAYFQDLDPQTRRPRRAILEDICQYKNDKGEITGEAPIAQVTRDWALRVRDRKRQTPTAANNYMKALRRLFDWGIEYGYATHNPVFKIADLTPINPDGHRAWEEGDVAKFEARHPLGTKARLALDLALYTGTRISDWA